MTERTPDIALPSDAELDPRMVAELAKHLALNIHRYLAPVPSCYPGSSELLAGIYYSGLDPRLRETVICRVGDEMHGGGPLSDGIYDAFTTRFDSKAAMSSG